MLESLYRPTTADLIYWPRMLPIYDIEQDIVAQLKAHRRLILQVPTGSGKSTQVPPILLKHGLLESGQAVILQPRRLAARLLAARVAYELKVELGSEVGYQIRFDHVAGPRTKIKFVTEGILLRQMLADPMLTGIQALIFDEFHERHLYGDITLAQALALQEKSRPDLFIIVMSATLETRALQNYLQPCATLATEGRAFPVEVEYAGRRFQSGDAPVWEMAAACFSDYIRSGGGGDVLVFMPGNYEIQQTLEAFRRCPEARGFLLLPLHGELSPREQDAAVAAYRQPKVVVSTNVAETSLTIDGIRLVIDSGLARIPRYDPQRGINTLLVEKISRAAADQRAGRAGRTAPGRCARLWSQQDHQDRAPHELPEVKRLDLTEVVLTLKGAGVEDLRRFRWLEPPEEQGLQGAESLLTDLGALDPAGRITSIGRKMLAFPLHPRYARMLLAAQDHGCVYQACLIAALTQGRDLLLRRPGAEVEDFREERFGRRIPSDFWLLMRAWGYAAKNDFRPAACGKAGLHAVTARQIGPLLEQFVKIAEREGLTVRAPQDSDGTVPEPALQKCILLGFSDRVARRMDDASLRCELVHGRRGMLARESVAQHSPLIVAAEVREVEGPDRSINTLLSLATAIEAAWLDELFPEDIRKETRVFYDAATKRVYAEEQSRFRGLTFASRKIEPPPQDAAARLLAGEVAAGRLDLKQWDDGVEQWILRVNFLARSYPELLLPPIQDGDRRDLIDQICLGAFSHKDIRDREVLPVVRSWLSDAQQELVEKHAPGHFSLPNGRRVKINYLADGPPYIAARIQELYDVKATPRLAMNRVPVLLQILAPSRRPVQITQDLAGFWREHYPRIKQELQRRYPRHEWR